MTESPEPSAPLILALHIDGDAPDAGDQVAGLPEVAQVEGVTTSDNRGLDVDTIMTTMMMITTVAGSAAAMTATIDNLIVNVKKLAARLGWKRVSVEVGRKTVDLDDLTAEQKQHLLEQALAQAKAASDGPAPA